MSRPAITLYTGHVMHMRLSPKRHRFRYRVFSCLFDLDRMEAAMAGSRIWGRVLRFETKDHGPRDGSALRPWVEEQLAGIGLPAPARIELHCFPRLWGYVFNPLSVYFCRDADERVYATLYEVKNTYGGQQVYVLPAEHGEMIRQRQDKTFWVSPFIPMEQTYRFDVAPPGEAFRLRIRQHGDGGEEVLIATHTATGRPATDAALARAVATHPLMTFKVIAAIHWEALRLALKGVRFLGTSDPATR
ncbi:DUF1365 domain-containing protein [Roseobacter sp. HKCCA0434]|uniref:DUF1365 domain-containing protein n=1 Tax=Roseobacter sp. HKCCA0434 TaxID=3079297 RepID=UPI002905F28C|nr:DUF1365 domain-containing protein [Roseobacter sp. HKCCA0434]